MNSTTRARIGLWILVLQLCVTLLAPSIPFGERRLFLGDLWALIWVPLAALWLFRVMAPAKRRSFALYLGVPFVLIVVAWLNGTFRPPMQSSLASILGAIPDDRFSFVREGVVAIRFVSWIWAAVVVARWNDLIDEPDRSSVRAGLERALIGVVFIVVASLVVSKLSPACGDWIKRVYGNDPAGWSDRVYGVFRSPLEANLTLSLAFLIFLNPTFSSSPSRLRVATFGALLLGIVLTRSLTGTFAAIVAVGVIKWIRLSVRWRSATIAVLVLAATAFVLRFRSDEYFRAKEASFVFRFRMWEMYWNFAYTKWNRFLFGTGFTSYFVDDIYVFIFSRGGVVMLASALISLGVWLKLRLKSLDEMQRALVLFFLISGVTLDNLIMRPVATLAFSFGTLALVGTATAENDPNRL